MFPLRFLYLILGLILGLAACEAYLPNDDDKKSSDNSVGCEADTPITFADADFDGCLHTQAIPLREEDGFPLDRNITFKDACQVTEIRCEGRGISDLGGLEHFVNLKVLSLAGNQVTAIPQLSSLSQLEQLNLSNNQLTNLDSLSTLTLLRTLDVSQNQLTSIGDLSPLVQIEELDLSENQLIQVGDLSSLIALRTLNLAGNVSLNCSNLNVSEPLLLSSGCSILPLEVQNLLTLNLSTEQQTTFNGQRWPISNEQSFTIPSGVFSFQISLFKNVSSTNSTFSCTSQPTNCVGFVSMIDPAGVDVLEANQGRLSLPVGDRYAGFLAPIVPDIPASPGTWKYRVIAGSEGDVNVKLTLRRNFTLKASTIVIQPFLATERFTQDELQDAFTKAVDIYENSGVDVLYQSVITLPSEFLSIRADFYSETTTAMLNHGNPELVNLFVVDDLLSSNRETLLGISGGLPGPQGISHNQNGVLVGLLSHRKGGVLRTDLLGETIAHEIGHWLGLFHTTEGTGKLFDPLTDTPQCTTNHDVDRNNRVEPDECEELDGTNLMFWTGDLNIDQTHLTPQQVLILNHSPIAQ